MTPDDQQLDALLRDVPVPDDLAARLKRIPRGAEIPVSPPRPSPWKSAGWITGLAIAASLLGLVAWLAWPAGQGTEPPVMADKDSPDSDAPLVAESTGQASALPGDLPNSPGPDPEMRGDDQVLVNTPPGTAAQIAAQIEILTWDIELHQQRMLLARLRARARAAQPASVLNATETRSLVAFTANRSALDWGADPVTIRDDMQSIIENYPETSGAERARQFLASSAN